LKKGHGKNVLDAEKLNLRIVNSFLAINQHQMVGILYVNVAGGCGSSWSIVA
jgi:hypothetical protein